MTSGSDGLHQHSAAQPWLWTHTANHWLAAQTAWTPWAEMVVPCRRESAYDPTRHPWQRVYVYSALAVFFGALLVWAMDVTSLRGVPNRSYNLRVLRAIGRYSYGIYVLHLPLYYITILAAARWRLLDPNHPNWASALLLVGVNAVLCGALAVVSFEFFEKPILNMKRFFPAASTRRPATLTARVPERRKGVRVLEHSFNSSPNLE